MWKLNLLFYIVDFSLVSFSNKYTIKLWFLKKKKRKKEKKWNPNEWCIFHLWNVHFLFIIDLYSPTLYKWNDQLEKMNSLEWEWHMKTNERKWKWTWHHFHVYFYLCFFMFISLFQSWTSSYFRISVVLEMDDVHISLSHSYCPYLRENTMSFLL